MILPCYSAMMRSASRRLGHVYNTALSEFGINIAQFSLLSMVKRTEPVSLTVLGKKMELDRSTIGRNVRVLQNMGLLEIFQSTEDKREMTLELTAKGHLLLQDVLPIWQKIQHDVENKIGQDKISVLKEILNSI